MELFQAFNNGNSALVLSLIKPNSKLNNKYLLTACCNRMDEVAFKLINYGCDLNFQNDIGTSPLIACCCYNLPKVAIKLIEQRANVNIGFKLHEISVTIYPHEKDDQRQKKDYFFPSGSTALHICILKNIDDVAVKLLEYGADTLENSNGNKPFDYLTPTKQKRLPKVMHFIKYGHMEQMLKSINDTTIMASCFSTPFADLNVLDLIVDFVRHGI